MSFDNDPGTDTTEDDDLGDDSSSDAPADGDGGERGINDPMKS